MGASSAPLTARPRARCWGSTSFDRAGPDCGRGPSKQRSARTMSADEARLAAIAARIEELLGAIAAGGLPEPEEQDLPQERLDLERERRRLRLRMQPEGGREETALSVFSPGYKGTECWGSQQANWGSLDEAARRDLRPRLERIAELERRIIDDLWLVLQAGPSAE